MEWVETTGRTLEEAKERALDQLGVHEEDAEFDVVEEPRPGLFSRIRGEARVRARVRPTQPRPKAERRDRKRKPQGEGASATPGEQGDPVPVGAAVGAGKNAADEPAAGGPTERGPTERASAEPGPGE